MKTGPDKSTCHPDQFQGQLYQAVYVYGFSLDQLKDAMDGVFEALKTITSIEIKIGLKQWTSRKKAWDKEWNIKDGGPSPDVRSELMIQRTWFYMGVDGKVAYKPLNLENLTLSMLPAGLSMPADISSSENQNGITTEGHGLDQTSDVDRRDHPYMEACGFGFPKVDPSVSSQNPWHPTCPSQTMFDINNFSTTPTALSKNLPSIVEGNTVPSNGLFGQQQHSPTVPQHELLATGPWNAPLPTPSYISPAPLETASHLRYTVKAPGSQSYVHPASSTTRNIYRLARDSTRHVTHPERVVQNAWSSPFQPFQTRPTSHGTPSVFDSHPYTPRQ